MSKSNSGMKSLAAYEKIRDMILRGSKLPGTRLILSDLEQELGIGRGPIREALMRLDRSGLVRNIPYKGAVVATPPKPKEIRHIYDLRVDLEVKLALEAMENMTPKLVSELSQIHGRMADAKGDFYELDRLFHGTLYEASDLPHLCSIVEKLILPVEIFLNVAGQGTDCMTFHAEHGRILEALEEKDAERLKERLSANIMAGFHLIEKTYGRMVGMPT